MRRAVGLLVILTMGCSSADGATASHVPGTGDVATTFPVRAPTGDIVARECAVPGDLLPSESPVTGVCTDFPIGVFGAVRMPANPALIPEFVAGSLCLVLWSETGADAGVQPSCYRPGSEPSAPLYGGLWDDAGHGYTYAAVLVPADATRIIARTMGGVDLAAVPLRGIALLWWPGGSALAGIYADTPAGPIEISPG